MSVVIINALQVPRGQEKTVENSFVDRKLAILGQPGLQDFRLLRPIEGEKRYYVMSRWESRQHFENWVGGPQHHAAHDHEEIGELLVFETVELG